MDHEELQKKLHAITEYVVALERRATAELTVLQLAVQALMRAAPEPELALQTFDFLSEQALAASLGTSVRDVRCEALELASAEVRTRLEVALLQRRGQLS